MQDSGKVKHAKQIIKKIIRAVREQRDEARGRETFLVTAATIFNFNLSKRPKD